VMSCMNMIQRVFSPLLFGVVVIVMVMNWFWCRKPRHGSWSSSSRKLGFQLWGGFLTQKEPLWKEATSFPLERISALSELACERIWRPCVCHWLVLHSPPPPISTFPLSLSVFIIRILPRVPACRAHAGQWSVRDDVRGGRGG
jgi:hypothetical protein